MKFWTYSTWSKRGRVRAIVLIAIAIVAAAAVLFAIPWTEQVVGFAKISPSIQWSLIQPEPGSFQTSLQRGDRVEIQKIHFREISNNDHLDFELADCIVEGSVIDSNKKVAFIGSWTMNSELEELKNERGVVDANLALLRAGARPEDIAVERKVFEIAQQNYISFTAEYERTIALHDSGFISDAEFETSANKYILLQKQIELAGSRVKALSAGESKERICVEEKTLQKLSKQIELLEESIQQDEIRTPISGIVIKPESASVFCTIAKLDEMAIKILVREQDLLYVHPGGKFILRPFALPHERYCGEIEYLHSSPIMLDNRSFFVALGHVDNDDGTLMPGMFGVARIYGKKTSIFRYVYDRIKHTIFVQFGI